MSSGKPKQRVLVRWNDDLDKSLLLFMYHTCADMGIKIPYDEIARRMGSTFTAGAIVQHLAKLRSKMADLDVVPVPPPTKKGTATTRPSTVYSQTRSRSPRSTSTATGSRITRTSSSAGRRKASGKRIKRSSSDEEESDQDILREESSTGRGRRRRLSPHHTAASEEGDEEERAASRRRADEITRQLEEADMEYARRLTGEVYEPVLPALVSPEVQSHDDFDSNGAQGGTSTSQHEPNNNHTIHTATGSTDIGPLLLEQAYETGNYASVGSNELDGSSLTNARDMLSLQAAYTTPVRGPAIHSDAFQLGGLSFEHRYTSPVQLPLLNTDSPGLPRLAIDYEFGAYLADEVPSSRHSLSTDTSSVRMLPDIDQDSPLHRYYPADQPKFEWSPENDFLFGIQSYKHDIDDYTT